MSERASDSAGRGGDGSERAGDGAAGAGRTGRRLGKPAAFEPVGRRPEAPSGTSDIGLGGEGSWTPERTMPAPDPSARARPAIDPARATPAIAPRPSTREPAPVVGVKAQAGRVLGERGCVHCGYNLHGSPMDGRCPECGHPLGDAAPARDGPLSSAAPRVVRTVALGGSLIAAAAALAWLLLLATLVGAVPAAFAAWGQLLAATIWVLGILVLTQVQQDPVARFNGLHERDGWRLAARWTAVKVPVFAALLVAPWVVGRMPMFAPGAGAAGTAAGAALADVLAVLRAVRAVLLPFFLVALGLGLVMVHRIAAWARDDAADRFIGVAQWTIPIGVLLMLLAGGPALGGMLPLRPPNLMTLVFLLAHAPLAFGLVSLGVSTVLCVHHEREARERAFRRAERRDEASERMADRIERATRG